MSDELVAVGTFWNANEAHMAKAVLDDAGIEAFLENEHSATITPHLASPEGVKLLVAKKNEQKAIGLLKPNEE